jgi:transposase
MPIVRVGVDLAKNVIQVHAVDAAGRKVVSKAIKRDGFVAWCAPPRARMVVVPLVLASWVPALT